MSLTLDLERFIAKAKGNTGTVVRKVAIDVVAKTVGRSPVGNPELWAANIEYRASNAASADAYDYNVAIRNTIINLTDSNFTKGGNLKRGVKYAKKLTKTERDQNFNVNGLVAGQGYVGGRFRGNWQVTFNTAASGTLARIDGQGAATIAAATGVVMGFSSAVGAIWVVNNLPYAKRLEYEGWSSQAPAGMVRITLKEFQTFVNKAVEGLP